jgi:hypothetical protein
VPTLAVQPPPDNADYYETKRCIKQLKSAGKVFSVKSQVIVNVLKKRARTFDRGMELLTTRPLFKSRWYTQELIEGI